MSSFVKYKFRNQRKEPEVVRFDGMEIGVPELKALICEARGLVDAVLELSDPKSKAVIPDAERVVRGRLVEVRRINVAAKLPPRGQQPTAADAGGAADAAGAGAAAVLAPLHAAAASARQAAAAAAEPGTEAAQQQARAINVAADDLDIAALVQGQQHVWQGQVTDSIKQSRAREAQMAAQGGGHFGYKGGGPGGRRGAPAFCKYCGAQGLHFPEDCPNKERGAELRHVRAPAGIPSEMLVVDEEAGGLLLNTGKTGTVVASSKHATKAFAALPTAAQQRAAAAAAAAAAVPALADRPHEPSADERLLQGLMLEGPDEEGGGSQQQPGPEQQQELEQQEQDAAAAAVPGDGELPGPASRSGAAGLFDDADLEPQGAGVDGAALNLGMGMELDQQQQQQQGGGDEEQQGLGRQQQQPQASPLPHGAPRGPVGAAPPHSPQPMLALPGPPGFGPPAAAGGGPPQVGELLQEQPQYFQDIIKGPLAAMSVRELKTAFGGARPLTPAEFAAMRRKRLEAEALQQEQQQQRQGPGGQRQQWQPAPGDRGTRTNGVAHHAAGPDGASRLASHSPDREARGAAAYDWGHSRREGPGQEHREARGGSRPPVRQDSRHASPDHWSQRRHGSSRSRSGSRSRTRSGDRRSKRRRRSRSGSRERRGRRQERTRSRSGGRAGSRAAGSGDEAAWGGAANGGPPVVPPQDVAHDQDRHPRGRSTSADVRGKGPAGTTDNAGVNREPSLPDLANVHSAASADLRKLLADGSADLTAAAAAAAAGTGTPADAAAAAEGAEGRPDADAPKLVGDASAELAAAAAVVAEEPAAGAGAGQAGEADGDAAAAAAAPAAAAAGEQPSRRRPISERLGPQPRRSPSPEPHQQLLDAARSSRGAQVAAPHPSRSRSRGRSRSASRGHQQRHSSGGPGGDGAAAEDEEEVLSLGEEDSELAGAGEGSAEGGRGRAGGEGGDADADAQGGDRGGRHRHGSKRKKHKKDRDGGKRSRRHKKRRRERHGSESGEDDSRSRSRGRHRERGSHDSRGASPAAPDEPPGKRIRPGEEDFVPPLQPPHAQQPYQQQREAVRPSGRVHERLGPRTASAGPSRLFQVATRDVIVPGGGGGGGKHERHRSSRHHHRH